MVRQYQYMGRGYTEMIQYQWHLKAIKCITMLTAITAMIIGQSLTGIKVSLSKYLWGYLMNV